MQTTGEKIRLIRQRRKKTLQEVADAIGASATTVSKYESGIIANIPTTKLNAIAEFLDVNPASLFDYAFDDQPLILSITEQFMMEDFRKLSEIDKETICIIIKQLLDAQKKREAENHKSQQLHL